MNDQDRRGHGWTVVLRRQPVRIVEGQPEGGYTDLYGLIGCDCGDHPGLDYRQVSPALQQIRGPYPFRRASRPIKSTLSGTAGGSRPPVSTARRGGTVGSPARMVHSR